jgi:Skp family chaperone for outer membrane proteins
MIKRITLLILILIVLAAPAFAQSGRIAFVDTSIFNDPDRGIKRLVNAVRSVDQEFAPHRAEFLDMQRRLQKQFGMFSFSGPIPTDPRPMTPERRKELKEQAEEMKRDFERKQKEVSNAYNERMNEIAAPIYEDIQKSLELFAKKRKITMLLDASKSTCCAGDCSTMSKLDITEEFIAEYNRLNP